MKRVDDFTKEKTPRLNIPWRQIIFLFLCSLIVVAFGFMDHYTGRELTFFQFYLIPVSLAGWYAGRWPGFLIAVASTLTWGIVDNWGGNPYSIPVIAYWNAFSRMTIFILAAYVIDKNRHQLDLQTRLAQLDGLTGAFNARHFIHLLNTEIHNEYHKNGELTLVYIDLDNFKQVNDSLGHSAGDDALASVVQIIGKHIRNTDRIGRMGGDEFALLLPNSSQNAARSAVDRLRTSLVEGMQSKGLPITFSIGVVTCSNIQFTGDEIIKKADNLMYKVKQTTKNGVMYECLSPLNSNLPSS